MTPDPVPVREAPAESLAAHLARRLPHYLLLPVIGSCLGLVLSFLVPSRYTSVASFFPETQDVGRDLGAFAGLAAQFGFGLAGSGQSPQFYVQVLSSRALLEEVLVSEVTRRDGERQRLLDYLVRRGADSARKHDKALKRLRAGVRATVNPRTDIVDLQVTLKDPSVAAQVAQRLLDGLNRFNLEVRRSQSGERRRFLEARLADAQDSLRQAEASVRFFLERNRSYRGSPGLEVERDRLARSVSTYQNLVTGLRRDYESARLDEVNDTPVLTLVDPPVVPSRRSSPSRVGAAASGLVLGLLAAALLLSGRAWVWRLRRERPDDFEVLARATSVLGRRARG